VCIRSLHACITAATAMHHCCYCHASLLACTREPCSLAVLSHSPVGPPYHSSSHLLIPPPPHTHTHCCPQVEAAAYQRDFQPWAQQQGYSGLHLPGGATLLWDSSLLELQQWEGARLGDLVQGLGPAMAAGPLQARWAVVY
jgi:hypothetical protein